MFREFVKFEMIFRLKKKLMAYVFFVVFFLMTFMSITTDVIRIGGGTGNVNFNSPFVIMQTMIIMCVIGIFVIVPLMATVVIRDYDLNTYPSFFTTQISKFNYLIGRFTGGYLVTLMAFSGLIAGMLLGSMMPWVDSERIGAFMIGPYLSSWLIFVIPNVFIAGSLFFALGTISRSSLWTYVGAVAFWIFWAVSGNLLRELDNQFYAGILDPFGASSFRLATQYWTPIEKNTLILPLDDTLLLNRFLWIGIAILALAVTVWRFRFTVPVRKSDKKKLAESDEVVGGRNMSPVGAILPVVTQNFTSAAYIKQFMKNTVQEFFGIIRTAPFIVIALFGLLNMLGIFFTAERMYGTEVHIVTRLMVSNIENSMTLFLIIILTIYGGELIWRSRQQKVHEYFDALPVPGWVPFVSKLLALIGVVYFLLLLASAVGVIMQLASGFTDIEFGLYFQALFVNLAPNIALLAFLVMFVHVLVNNKYLGHAIVITYYIGTAIAFDAMGINHNLLLFGGSNLPIYSDMNGFGHFLKSFFWFNVYYFFFALVLAIIARLFWVRGTNSGLKARLQEAGKRRGRTNLALLGLAVAGFFFTGGFIYYNTNVVNEYRNNDADQLDQVAYETKYKRYDGLPQPRIVDVYSEVDIYPEQRDFDLRGYYWLLNKTDAEIDSVHIRLNYPNNVSQEVNNFVLGNSQLVHSDSALDYYIYKLESTLLPGDSLKLEYDISYRTSGFMNSNSNNRIVFNGTFINNQFYFPHIGYSRNLEITDPSDRREHELPPRKQMAAIDDTLALQNTYLGYDADWVNFETIVSTSPDQIAISPGYLQREWEENDRRYFHYKMDVPILNFYSYLSARYEVARKNWNGIDLEIYHHAPHDYNLDKMFKSIKHSISYFEEHFSPYQFRQMRILEFPRYASFAQSFPNTVPYSESIGFIANLQDEDDIDYVYYVTAHEVAHQWWAHQVISGNVQGATVMVETMAQYSALMVMEKEYGKEKMHKFLRYEMDRYLRGRSSEQVREWPLIYNTNQGYIHYRKGSVIMYALRDYIGEEKLNGALRKYIEATAYQEAPFTTSLEFLSYIEEVVPDSLNYIIEDWFKTITLYDNRVDDVFYTETNDEQYEVEINVESRKLRADSLGLETEIALADYIEIGVLGEDRKELYLAKHKLEKNQTSLKITVDELPVQAGIDPYNKLIDRNPKDNLKAVSRK